MIAMDFGAENKLCLDDGRGAAPVPHKLPRYKKDFKGLLPHEKFALDLEILLQDDDVVCESATIGSSGAEVGLIRVIVESAPHRLYTLSGRVVKNWCKTRKLDRTEISDHDAAAILHRVAVTNPDALQVWRYRDDSEKLHRVHTSVRPYDKRKYTGPEVDAFMARLPEYEDLPPLGQFIWGDGKDYSRSRALPFAMAFDEEGSESREGYERIIGLYGHGYPSFYRRATIVVMQRVAEDLAGVSHIDQVTPRQFKEAWKITRREIRRLYHMAKGTAEPAKGTILPYALAA